MEQKSSKLGRWLKKGMLVLPLLLVLAVLLNGFLAAPLFASRAESAGLLFQSPLPTPTFTPTAEAPTNTPTPEPPTNTPTTEPPTNTPTAEPPTNTPTAEPPTNTPTAEPPTNTPTAEPPTDTPVPPQAPEITSLTVPLDPVAVDTPITTGATFTDPNPGDTHRAQWSWGDSTASTCPSDGVDCRVDQNSDSVSGSHAYAEPGVYQITLTVTDREGLSDTAVSDFVVVYDPDGGFVSGGGWIYSEPDWCKLSYCKSLEGKATFGFFSEYKKGATVPSGYTRFNFQAGNLRFQSDSYQWLVVNQGGRNAQFKGSGTINGELAPGVVPYQFMLRAGDGDPDTFRITISYETPAKEVVVYNVDADAPLGGGSIVIHGGN